MRRVLQRLLPILLAVIVYTAWMADIQNAGPWFVRNAIPIGFCVSLLALALYRNSGYFLGEDPRLLFGTLGFAIPSVGLSAYLHYAYAVNLNDMFTGASRPGALFRFLPFYTSVAGCIGFAIGWIVGARLRK